MTDDDDDRNAPITTGITEPDPVDELIARLGKIEALIAAADDRVDAVPAVSDKAQQRRLSQLIELLSEARSAASDAVDFAEREASRLMPRPDAAAARSTSGVVRYGPVYVTPGAYASAIARERKGLRPAPDVVNGERWDSDDDKERALAIAERANELRREPQRQSKRSKRLKQRRPR